MNTFAHHVLAHRWSAVALGALLVNLLLVAAIHALVNPRGTMLPARPPLRFVAFVRLAAPPDAPAERHETPPSPQRASAARVMPTPPSAPAATAATSAIPPSIAALPVPFDLLPLPALPKALAVAPTGAPKPAGSTSGDGSGDGGSGGTGTAVAPGAADVDVNLVPTYRVAPGYPRQALRDGVEGVVTVEFTVDAEGKVHDPKVVLGDPPGVFDAAVLAVMPQWRFSPKIVDGHPIERHARQDVRFSLHKP